MESTKKPLQSKTIIGAVITLIALAFPQFVSEGELTEIISLVTALGGVVLTIYGRIVAEKKVTLK